MNPSLEYAQIRMGHDGNRGSNWGLIDVRSIVRVVDALRLLYGSPAFSGDDWVQVNRWLEDYQRWLIISKNGRLEREAPNNHGSWYLCQVIAIARHLGDEEEARQFAREDFARITNQFAPDGSQPLEMVRVDGLEYCAFNLEAQFQIARLAAPLDVDLWHYEGTNGASLQRGIEFLRFYNVTPESWPHNQLKTLKPGFLQTLLDQADRVWPNAGSDVSRGQPAQPDTGAAVETPATLPGSETHIYRDGTSQPMRLHVFKPTRWQAGDRRPAMLFFFGGGWSRGTPEKSAGWAKYAASLGMVGIAPDYRTRERFGTSPLESVADGRAALRWVQDHVGELGINPAKIVTGGSSAGGHVALWTAIERSPPGSDPKEAPTAKPAAVILFSAVSDTSVLSGYTPHRFGTNAVALSPINQLDVEMPPMLMFHGDSDPTVPYQQALALHARLVATSNVCELITVPGGNHGFTSQLPEWKKRSQEIVENFLASQALMPALAK